MTKIEMKGLQYPIVLLCFLALFAHCKKTEEPNIEPPIDEYFTDLHDTLLYVDWACYDRHFSFDIDKDSTFDIKITCFSSYSSTGGGSRSYVEITPLNGYEIVYSNQETITWSWNPEIDTIYHIDTVRIPKAVHIGDTIFLEDYYTSDPIMIKYAYTPSGPGSGYSSGLNYGIQEESDYYMGFRNTNGDNHKLAWLRVKNGNAYKQIILNSCKYIENEDMLIIE